MLPPSMGISAAHEAKLGCFVMLEIETNPAEYLGYAATTNLNNASEIALG